MLFSGRSNRHVQWCDDHTWAFNLKVSLVSSDTQAMQAGMPRGIPAYFAWVSEFTKETFK